MNDNDFLGLVEDSFVEYLTSGPRSNAKLKILHGGIASDLNNKLGKDYEIKALGYGLGIEYSVEGRYMDKKVDITILKSGKVVAGIGVKYVMSNYSQNSINYFENMLGETANIRSNNTPYFEIIVIADKVPYFNRDGEITKIEKITNHNLEKYMRISKDEPDIFFHIPNKTLLYMIQVPSFEKNNVHNKKDYIEYFSNIENLKFEKSNEIYDFSSQVVYNEYEKFINKLINYINYIVT